MRRLTTFLTVVVAMFCASQSALADKRVAFVVGNSSYKNAAVLANPVNDAAAMAQMFRKASFDVVESRHDLTNNDMRRALRDFTEKAVDADVAVIYYAGHGIEVEGVNYLVPVDAVLERDTDAYDEAIALDRILQRWIATSVIFGPITAQDGRQICDVGHRNSDGGSYREH